MDGKRQFSLGYLLLEVFWIALALGTTRLIAEGQYHHAGLPMLAILAYPTALSGAFGRMWVGAVIGLVTDYLIFILTHC